MCTKIKMIVYGRPQPASRSRQTRLASRSVCTMAPGSWAANLHRVGAPHRMITSAVTQAVTSCDEAR